MGKESRIQVACSRADLGLTRPHSPLDLYEVLSRSHAKIEKLETASDSMKTEAFKYFRSR